MEQRLAQCVAGQMKFLYVSPERLLSPLFRAYLAQLRLCLIVVDEAHCLSQWGYDFRPAYLRIAEIRTSFPAVPLLALTATATPQSEGYTASWLYESTGVSSRVSWS